MKTTLYRYENTLGERPYLAENTPWIGDIVNKWGIHLDEDHPSPSEDGMKLTKHHLCACTSLNNLLEWFEEYNQELQEVHYQIYEIAVNDCQIGKSGKQAIFLPMNIIDKQQITK